MTDFPAVEIRRNPDETIDEVVASNCQSVQIEQMSDCDWYLEIVGSDGGLWQFWIGAKNGRSHVELRLTEAATADVIT